MGANGAHVSVQQVVSVPEVLPAKLFQEVLDLLWGRRGRRLGTRAPDADCTTGLSMALAAIP